MNEQRAIVPTTPASADQVFWSQGYADQVVAAFRRQVVLVKDNRNHRIGLWMPDNKVGEGQHLSLPSHMTTYSNLPPIFPEWLGERTFQETHQVRFPYICGEMANAIASVAMVVKAARAHILSFFGAAGLSLKDIASAIDQIHAQLGGVGGLPWGSNLIHTPNETGLEDETVALYLAKGVRRVSASAFITLTPAIVRYACTGLSYDQRGRVVRKNFLFAKISRPEVAEQFINPAPLPLLNRLLSEGKLTPQEVALAQTIPLAEDITVEADSGGHTDNQALPALFPIMIDVRNKIARHRQYHSPIRLGVAGGMATPQSITSAFAMGAAYVLTGSINQSSIEAGLHDSAKKLLCQVGIGDVTMAPAADMFEQGIKVQVLKRGTFFPMRAQKLFECYKAYSSLDDLPTKLVDFLEKDIFRASLEQAWQKTALFWQDRNPHELVKARGNPRHKMALLFRSYLGLASQWAIKGVREEDFQIWCGPAMAAFNQWVKNSFLHAQENRTVVQIALNLLEGAAKLTRAQQLRSMGVVIPESAFTYSPLRLVLKH